ncbi:MAG: hypothetical protein IJP21_04655 [Clostridia bacterium]|jgi:hypothetical protein|nr:hypothetical protein [Clostridia bacterium]
MSKNKILITVYVLTIIVTLFNLVGFIKDSAFYSTNSLPQGEFLYASMSPDGNKTVRIFKVENSIGKAIRGELVILNDDGTDTVRNIYWSVGEDNAMTGWQTEDIVTINDINIDTTDEDYAFDSRRELEYNDIATLKIKLK